MNWYSIIRFEFLFTPLAIVALTNGETSRRVVYLFGLRVACWTVIP